MINKPAFQKTLLRGALLFFAFSLPFSLSAQQTIEQILSGVDPQTRAQIEQNLSTLDAETRAQVEKQVISSFSSSGVSPATIQQTALTGSTLLETTPVYPGPFEEVAVTLSSSLADLNRADVSWSLNGKSVAKGYGKTELVFTTGDVGAASVIDVTIKTADGARINKKMTINPAGITLLWEAESYTPPFYKGKALLSPRSTYRMIAIPNFIASGKAIPRGELVYTWRLNNKVVQKSSGYGKNIFYSDAPIPLWRDELSVEVSTLGKTINAYKKISLDPAGTTVIFYEDDPIEGVRYETALGQTFDLAKQELTVKAEPYFFAKKDMRSRNIAYDWKLNEASVGEGDDTVTFRQGEAGGGTARIGLTIKNFANTFQTAASSFALNFKNAGAFNF